MNNKEKKSEEPIPAEVAPRETESKSVSIREMTEFTKQEAGLFLASLVDAADDAIIGKNLDGTIVSWNRGAEQLYGFTAAEAIGSNISIIVPEDRLIELQLILSKLRNGEGIRHFETLRQRKDGSTVYVSLTVSPVCDSRGQVRAASVISRDITDRKFAEEALKKSEERYRIIVETSHDIIWSIDSSGYFTFMNQACTNVLGYMPSEMIGRHFTQFQGRKFAEKDIQLLKDVLSGKIVDIFETELIHKEGRNISLFCDAVAIRDDEKRIIGVSGTASDITARKQIQETIKQSEEKYKTLFEESKDVVFIVSAEGKIMDLNQAGLELLGYSSKTEAAQLDIKRDLEWNYQDRQKCQTILAEQGYVKDYPIVLQKPNGQRLDLLISATAQRDESGQISQVRGIAKDITALKRTEGFTSCLYKVTRVLAESATLEEAAPKILKAICGALVCETGIFWVTRGTQKLQLFEFYHSGRKNELAESWQSIVFADPEALPNIVLASGQPRSVKSFQNPGNASAEFAHREGFRSGFAFPVQIANLVDGVLEFYRRTTLEGDQQLMVVASSLGNQIGQFIQRKRAEEALKESEKKYRSFVEDDLTGIYISTVDGKLLTCNPAFLRMFGFHSTEEALNHNLSLVYRNPEERKDFVEKIRDKKKLEYREYELRNRKGEPVYVVENAFGIFDENNELVTIKGYIVDTTDRKKLEQQLIQVQKMEAIGRLAGGVAHDFNNILMAITSYIELLLIRMHELDPLRPYVSEIRKAAEQGGNLTGQLLAFSRRQVLTPKFIDLNDSILGMENMLRRLIGDDIQLEIVNSRNLGTVRADPGQIEQILMNVAVNARDAMPGGGTLRIETSNIEVDQEVAGRHPGLLPGSFVLLSIEDSGHGMTEETVQRIFEPFFTTKEEGKGTGLGLATVFGIVKQSGGFIYVQSKWGAGTTFSIYLPRIQETPQTKLTESGTERAIGQGETILLVDDNEMVRTAAGSFLELNGYRVLYADRGATAITLLKNRPEINMMISDVVMPEMSGVEVAEAAKAFCPQLKMLFMSGYTDEQTDLQSILNSGCEYISKPVMMSVLLKKIRELLSS